MFAWLKQAEVVHLSVAASVQRVQGVHAPQLKLQRLTFMIQ